MTNKVSEFLKGLENYNNIEPEGAIVIILKTIKGVDYIEHQPEFTFVDAKEIKKINGKQYLKSNYLTQRLERKYKFLFLLPDDNRN